MTQTLPALLVCICTDSGSACEKRNHISAKSSGSVKMLLLLLFCGGVSCWVTCPDGKIRCNDQQTCCFTTEGYRCCHYPNAVCCPDHAHCCPFGYECDQTTQMCVKRSENKLLFPREEAAPRVKPAHLQEGHAPFSAGALPSVDQTPPSVDQALPSADQALSSVDQAPHTQVYCDPYYTCPDGYTCCQHPGGGWTCCPYSPARCCLDGYHCCPYGYDCDRTYTHCIRQGVPYPFNSRRPSTRAADRRHVPQPLSSSDLSAQTAALTFMAQGEGYSFQEGGVIHCDSMFYCPKGSTCCQNQSKQWNCCPYPLGMCCADGTHCCQYGYTCDPTSRVCRK